MNAIDPRELGDRALLAYLLFGDLPRRGWPGRGRALALRMLQVAGLTGGISAGILVVSGLIVLAWAAMQAPA